MDKTTRLLIGIGSMIVLVLIAVLIILDKDPTRYVGSLATIVTVLTGIGILGKRQEQIAKNVNGNSTKLLNENAALREALLNALNNADHRREIVAPPLMSEDTVGRIQEDVDKLPKHAG